MLGARIKDKRTMYGLLKGGAFGNTNPQWSNRPEWLKEGAPLYDSWGIRSLRPGGECALYVPTNLAEVALELATYPFNISPMIEHIGRVTLMADVFDSEEGIKVYGIVDPKPHANWRLEMPGQGREYAGLTARKVLEAKLNDSSLEDLKAILEHWPGHIVELSCLDRCFGTVPGRNAIIWEVRPADGSYERNSGAW